MKKADKINKNDHVSAGISEKQRTFHFALKGISASLTLEAALVLPLFIFFIVALLNFILLVSLQTDIQLAVEESARSLGKKMYLAENAKDITQIPDEEEGSLIAGGITDLAIRASVLKGSMKAKLDASAVKGGSAGLHVYNSSYDADTGILDIIVNYTYKIPYLPSGVGELRMAQRCRAHVWTGRKLKDSGGAGSTDSGKVYVTPHGSVYHKSKACPYLDLSVQAMSQEEAEAARNRSGGKYYLCTDCCKKGGQYSTVYVTDYGTNMHSDINCTGLKRTLIEKDMSEVGSMHACPKCGVDH